MKLISAIQISKNLPMKVKSLAKRGMFVDEFITFDKCRDEEGKDWQLIGKTDSNKRSIILQKDYMFEIIK